MTHPTIKPRKLADGRYAARVQHPQTGSRDHSAGRARTIKEAQALQAAWYARWDAEHTRGRPDDVTLREFVAIYLDRHAAHVRERTTDTLRKRLRHAEAAFGTVPLSDLEHMTGEIAGWRSRLTARSGHGIASALRQVLAAAVDWKYMGSNPAKGRNPAPPPRSVRAFTPDELDAIASCFPAAWAPYRGLPQFVAATGLRPEEWLALERRDIDRRAGVLSVHRTVSSGKVVELGKTARSRRELPLSARALAALDAIPAQIATPLIFSGLRYHRLLNLQTFRQRAWTPAVRAAGIVEPARVYDLRSTFASDALASRITVFELARIMGTSAEMIERHYGTLIEGAGASIAARLNAFYADRAAAEDEAAENR